MTREMLQLNVAVDVGRSSIKAVADGFEGMNLPSVVAFGKNAYADGDSNMANLSVCDIVHECTISDGELQGTYLFGETAELRGDRVHDLTEGETFHKVSAAAILYMVAYYGYQKSKGYKVPIQTNIELGINLTFDNHHNADFYKKVLQDKHSVRLTVVEDGAEIEKVVTFDLRNIYCFYQGYAALFAEVFKEGFDPENLPYSNDNVLIVDIGRRTVDLALLNEFQLKEGESRDLGTQKMYLKLQKEVRARGLKITLPKLEKMHREGRSAKTLTGKVVTPIEISREIKLVDWFYSALHQAVLDFVGEQSVEHVLLCGGGANIVEKRFRAKFPSVIAPASEDPEHYLYANAEGMLSFIKNVG